MFYTDSSSLSAVKYFLESGVQALNCAQKTLRARRISMMGLSGGAWTKRREL